jgi:hypothetical protein
VQVCEHPGASAERTATRLLAVLADSLETRACREAALSVLSGVVSDRTHGPCVIFAMGPQVLEAGLVCLQEEHLNMRCKVASLNLIYQFEP